ncbi:MAG TPA: GFA family protein [Usitatibacter sp.]|nr:GFA family protein [Usitatibacter sp.]
MDEKYEGGCTCGEVRYRVLAAPMFVHCCHCTWCQRETGTAFALNALLEADNVELTRGEPELVDTPSNSGTGQAIARCRKCHVALWSNYGGIGDWFRFLRVGTLDWPARFAPDIHIFTSTKQPWVAIPETMRAVPEYYKSSELWPRESLERREKVMARMKAAKAQA